MSIANDISPNILPLFKNTFTMNNNKINKENVNNEKEMFQQHENLFFYKENENLLTIIEIEKRITKNRNMDSRKTEKET